MTGRKSKTRWVLKWYFIDAGPVVNPGMAGGPSRKQKWFCESEIRRPKHPPKKVTVPRRRRAKRDKRRYRRIRGKR